MRKAAHSCHLYTYCGSVAYCAPTFLCGRFSHAINAARQYWGAIHHVPDTKEMFSLFPHSTLHTNRLKEWNNALKYCHILLLYYNNLQK